MKKGCIIALIIFAVLVIIGSIIAFKVVGPKIMTGVTSGLVFTAETAVESYTREYGEPPKGDHEKVVKLLRGGNPKEINFFGGDVDGQVVDGLVVDAWRVPLKMTRNDDGSISFSSAGPDGEHGNDDDVSGAGVRNLVKKIEEKAEAKIEAEAPKAKE